MKRAAGKALLGVLVFAGAGLAGTGCAATDADWRERYLEKEQDASQLSSQLATERSARAAAVSQLEEARVQIAQLQRNQDARPAEAGEPAAPAGNTAAVSESVDRLKGKGFDAYTTADGNIAIVLPSDINFAAGSKDLTPAGRKAVDQIAGELEGQFAGHSIRIEGHTDGDPIKKAPFKDNWELGSERALSVLRSLVNDHKIAPERLIPASRGETVPVADNKSDKGKARNRRVEIVVLVPHDSTMAK